jgi:hypothetical protein
MFFSKKADPGRDPGYPRFPLDLRIGAILAVDEAEILRFEGLGLSWLPPREEVLVGALSSMALFDLHLVRAYARRGDERLLFQFNLDASEALLDVNIFLLLEEIWPVTPDDWAVWLDPGGLIGGADLNAPNGQHYLRQWGEGAAIQPVATEERIYTDAAAPPHIVNHRMMLYTRELGEEIENMLLSADADGDTSLVRAWVGLNLNSVGVRIY